MGLIGGLEGNYTNWIGIQYELWWENDQHFFNQQRNVRMKVKIRKHGHCSNIIKYIDTVEAVSVCLGVSMFCGYVYIDMQHYLMVDVHIDREVS